MEDKEVAARIREWMRDVIDRTGISVSEWAKRAGVARSTIARPLRPDYEYVTTSRILAKLADAIGEKTPSTLPTPQLRVAPRFLVVRYKTQSGYWVEGDDYMIEGLDAPRPVVPDPRFEGMDQWLELVIGDSVDREIPDGSYAHVVGVTDYMPRAGDFVVVERRRDGGNLRERSIKRVKQVGARIELWPHSHNPKWDKPVSLHNGADDGTEAAIVGLVIGAYRSMLG